MKELKYNICDEVYFLNTSTGHIEPVKIKGAQVMPVGISKNEKGEDVLDGDIVLYQTFEGVVISEPELFATREKCKEHWQKILAEL